MTRKTDQPDIQIKKVSDYSADYDVLRNGKVVGSFCWFRQAGSRSVQTYAVIQDHEAGAIWRNDYLSCGYFDDIKKLVAAHFSKHGRAADFSLAKNKAESNA